MSKKRIVCYALIFVGLLVLGGLAQAAPPPPPAPPATIAPSYDFFKSPAGLNSQQDFVECPVPGIFFEESSTPVLTGCDTFDGLLHLRGVPLVTFLGETVGNVDTAVYRTDELDFGLPTEDVTAVTSIELQALNLASASPVKITCDQGVTNWVVRVEVDEDTGPSLGQMEVTLDHPDNLGGTAASSLAVCPRVTFTRADPGASGSYTLYPCDLGCEFNLLGETEWSYSAPPGAPVLRLDGLTADNFFFTELLSAEEQVALVSLDDDDCPCVFKYPHLSENHRHQACLPCPCDADQDKPVVDPPAAATMECTSRGGSFIFDPCVIPPGHPDFVCSFDWFDDVLCDGISCASPPPGECDPSCTQELGKIRTCEAQPPSFLTAACGGHPNDIDFRGEDCCDNSDTKPSVLTVTDTRPPVVTPGGADLFTLARPAHPPNHDYVCLDQGDFTGVREPDINDVCFDYTWIFTDCASSQPDDAPGGGDGNTTDDCHVCQGAGDTLPECLGYDAGEAFCVRAERAGNDPDGRRYAVEVRPTDDCLNVGVAEVVGFVHVPHLPPPPPVCDADPTSGPAPLNVTFSEATNAVEYLSWDWDFDGDGTIDSTLEDPPPFTYATAGSYDPTLTVSDGLRDIVVDCGPIVVDPAPTCELPELRKSSRTPDDDGDGLIDFDIRDSFGPDATVSSITQDEPLTGCGTGNDQPDAEIDALNPALFEVRPEACANQRDGGDNDGRVYHVTVLVNGQTPAFCNGGDVTLCVLHDRRQGGGCIDSGPPYYDSTANP